MIISRLKQMYIYFMVKYERKNDPEVKKILSSQEFQIFDKMDNYDKVHSFDLLQKILKNEMLSKDMNYLKLALLHDSAKGNVGFWERLKQVVIKKSMISDHAQKAYDNLKSINSEVAILCKVHHQSTSDEKMKLFQELDEQE